MKAWFASFFALFFPRVCIVCSGSLIQAEECICVRCNIQLPRTQYHVQKENPIERRLYGLMPVEQATAFFYYQKESRFRHIIHELKYKGGKHIGEIMGRQMASEIVSSGFFNEVDMMMPIPLHKKKLKSRGYNQSEWLAQGIAQVTGIPLITCALRRTVKTETQTTKKRYERWENMQDVFELHQPEKYAGMHILLVDDVLTTGATIVGCTKAFAEVKNVRFSVITLGVAVQ